MHDKKKKEMEKHFKVSGGELVKRYSNGVEVLTRDGMIIFRSDEFTKTFPMNWFMLCGLVEHFIVFYDNKTTYTFNCNDQSLNILCKGQHSVTRHYVYNGDIYIQLDRLLVRVSDKLSLHMPYKTDYFIKGNSRYTVIAYVTSTQPDSCPVWDVVSCMNPRTTFQTGHGHKLQYTIYETPTMEEIGTSKVGIPSPKGYGDISMQGVSEYLQSVSERIQVTDTHIDIHKIHYEYITDTVTDAVTGEECCVCFERTNMEMLPCKHEVCVNCKPKIQKCPLCRADIEPQKFELVLCCNTDPY